MIRTPPYAPAAKSPPQADARRGGTVINIVGGQEDVLRREHGVGRAARKNDRPSPNKCALGEDEQGVRRKR